MGVGEKPSPLSSSSKSCGVSSYVLRLCIVKSDGCLGGAGLKKKLMDLVGRMVKLWYEE